MYNMSCQDRAFNDANDFYYADYMYLHVIFIWYSVSVREFNECR